MDNGNAGRNPTAGRMARLFAAMALAALVAGCGENLSPDERVERAGEHRAAGEWRDAIIELRNALQQDPQHARARAMLGRTHLQVSDPAAAAKELSRAIELGVPRQTLVIELGEALLLQGESARMLEDIRAEDDWPGDIRAGVLGLRARAHLLEGELERAQGALDDALAADPEALQAQLAGVELALAQDRPGEARVRAERAAGVHPNSPDAWRAAARAALAQGETEAAERALDQAIEHAGNPRQDHLLRARVRVSRGDLEGARADLDKVGKAHANRPQVRFARALIAWAEQDFEQACTELQQAVSDAPQYAEARFFHGACLYRSGELSQARSHLGWVHQRSPSAEVARLFAATLLQLEQFREARAVIKPVIDANPEDQGALALLSRIEMNLGNTGEAIEYLDRLARLRPDDPRIKLQLGAGLVQSGQVGASRAAFGEALELDPQLEEAGAMLVLSHLQAGDTDKALAQARKLAASQPDAALPRALVGVVHVARGDEPAARAALAEAIELEPGDPAARTLLARLDQRAGDLEAARGHYEAILRHHPEQTTTLLALARLESGLGRYERTGELLERAHASDPEALLPRVLLGRLRLTQQRPKQALDLVSEDDRSVPREAPALEVAARAHLALGQPASALEHLEQWIALTPSAPGVYLLMAQAYDSAGDTEAAIEHLEKEIANDPGSVIARVTLARARMQQDNDDEARAQLDALPDSMTGHPRVLETRAMLATRGGDHERAVALYRRVMEADPAADTVVRLSRALASMGDREGAAAVFDDWLADRPGQAGVRMLAADLYLQLGREEDAIDAYREVLEERPDTVQALNNLAWLLRERAPDESLELAQRAVELAPQSGAVRDTLGTVLQDQGRLDEAIEHFRRAVDSAPTASDIRFHLARALSADGQTAEARKQVRQALESGTEFSERAEAEALLRDLE